MRKRGILITATGEFVQHAGVPVTLNFMFSGAAPMAIQQVIFSREATGIPREEP